MTMRLIRRIGLAFALLCLFATVAHASLSSSALDIELCVGDDCYNVTYGSYSYTGSITEGDATVTVRCNDSAACSYNSIDKATLNNVSKDLDANYEAEFDVGTLEAGTFTINAKIWSDSGGIHGLGVTVTITIVADTSSGS